MKKNFMNTLAAALLTGAVAVSGLTACSSSDDNILGEQPATEQSAAVKTYRVSIPASFGGDGAQTRAVSFDGTKSTTYFTAGETAIVRNATTGKPLVILNATNISADGKSCDFEGSIVGTIIVGDVLELLYNLKEEDLYQCDYTKQTGTASTVVDAAVARLKVKALDGEGNITFCQEDDTDDATAHFKNLQSMFRLKFQDADSNPIRVRKLTITSANGAIFASFNPLGLLGSQTYTFNPITVTPASATSDYLYVAIKFDESHSADDVLTFTVTDIHGNVYEGTKTAPSGGFKNGKYYYNSASIQLPLKEKFPGPDIEWISVTVIPEPDGENLFSVYGPWNGSSHDPSEITISGTGAGYRFYMYYGATIHLSSLTATYDESSDFIYSDGDLNLDISGTNTITCKNYSQAISADGTLKLSGNGTITVTAKNSARYGLYATSNYNNSNNSDASVLAAAGYTVTRSAVTNNVDGTYTWTYTVAPE